MTGTVAAVTAGLPYVSGALLALTTIKPQSAVGIVGWLLLWSLSRWNERKGVFISFCLTMSVMLAGAELLLPGWVWEWREAISAYMHYAPLPGAFVELMFGKQLGKIVGGLVVLGTFVFCWKARKDAADTDRFKLAPALILSANLFITPVWHAYDQIFLLPPALLMWQWRGQFYRLKPFQRAILSLSGIAMLWQWVAAAVGLTVLIIAPGIAFNLQLLPYWSILLFPPLALASLVLMGRAQLSMSVVPGRLRPGE
jgi:hypothetical protein